VIINVHPEATGAVLQKDSALWFLVFTGPSGGEMGHAADDPNELSDALRHGYSDAEVVSYVKRQLAAAGYPGPPPPSPRPPTRLPGRSPSSARPGGRLARVWIPTPALASDPATAHYYDRRAAEYDEWYTGQGSFAQRDRPGWTAGSISWSTWCATCLPPARSMSPAAPPS